ncbi:hypothetical protein [Caballeronia cordobensis]|uniref:hypothetical protein n=1 Tax=Caballeronia cordobensis TaxID=1353886 RepID=UPI00045F024E|nr:hypothetical protein BRPE67_FCDS00540 [Burkholderia sp. RPE67]
MLFDGRAPRLLLTFRPRVGRFSPSRARVFVAPHHLALKANTLLRGLVSSGYAPIVSGAGVLPAHFFTHGMMRTGAKSSVRYATTMQ